jgi:ABC-type uncharacterized transport system permease subunit
MLSSLQPELLRMMPYIIVTVVAVLLGLLLDIRNTLKQINDTLSHVGAGRYLRY